MRVQALDQSECPSGMRWHWSAFERCCDKIYSSVDPLLLHIVQVVYKVLSRTIACITPLRTILAQANLQICNSDGSGPKLPEIKSLYKRNSKNF
jgi:hypothetical protein